MVYMKTAGKIWEVPSSLFTAVTLSLCNNSNLKVVQTRPRGSKTASTYKSKIVTPCLLQTLSPTMAFYMYKKIKKARNERKQQDWQQQIRENGESPIPLNDHRVSEASTPELNGKSVQEHELNTYRRKLVFGLALPFTVQALDLTVIAPATPFIAADFSKHPHNIKLT